MNSRVGGTSRASKTLVERTGAKLLLHRDPMVYCQTAIENANRAEREDDV